MRDQVANDTSGPSQGRADVEQGTTRDEGNLLEQIKSISGQDVSGIGILSFRALQLYRLAKLQGELVTTQKKVIRHEIDENKDGVYIDFLLQRYADAIRNYETLSQDVIDGNVRDYNLLTDSQRFRLLYREGSRWARWKVWVDKTITVGSGDSEFDQIGSLGFRELDKQKRIERERRTAYHSRLLLGLFGGVALIVPLIIMSLRRGLAVDLITTSVATVIFVIILVVFARDATGKDVLASTAAYAAVLVVFVGASLGTTCA